MKIISRPAWAIRLRLPFGTRICNPLPESDIYWIDKYRDVCYTDVGFYTYHSNNVGFHQETTNEIKKAPKAGKSPAPKTLRLHEEVRLLDWLYANRSYRDYVAVLTILRTGLRNRELRGLIVSDISFDGEIFTQLEVRSAIAKTKKPRLIPLHPELRAKLKTFLDWKKLQGEPITAMSFLFATQKSPQITERHLQRIVRQATVHALGKPYCVHDLRHTFASRLLRKSNVVVLQKILGHQDIRTTQIYLPASTDAVTEAIEAAFSF
jgi:site-specific recombinase XerD